MGKTMTYTPQVSEQDKTALWQALSATSTPKDALIKRLKMNDRKVRAVAKEINSDPNNDYLVLTDTDNGGYWRAVKNDDNSLAAFRYYYSEQSRRDELTQKLKIVEKKINRLYPAPGQGRLC